MEGWKKEDWPSICDEGDVKGEDYHKTLRKFCDEWEEAIGSAQASVS